MMRGQYHASAALPFERSLPPPPYLPSMNVDGPRAGTVTAGSKYFPFLLRTEHRLHIK